MPRDIRAKFYEICFRDLNVDISKMDPNADFRSKISIDSMQYVEIYAALALELNLDIPLNLMEAKTINQMIGILEKAVCITK